MTDFGNIIHQTFGGEAAQARVVTNQLDPEKAQRAVEIGDATGIEPSAVAENLDEFDQYHKASLGAQIVKKNQALKQYLDLHPMAAGVSSDDLGQLDLISDRIKDLNEEDPYDKVSKIFWEGFGEGPEAGFISGKIVNNPNNFNEDGTLKYPYLTAMAIGAGNLLDLPLRAFGGALAVGEAAIAGTYTQATGDESGGRRLARDFSGMVDTYMNAFMGRTPKARQHNQGIRDEIQKVALDQRAQMYWQNGKALPIGLSKEFDAAIERVSKEYWKKIDDLASEADKSATKERNPEYFRTFVEQHPELEGAYIRVDAEAVRRLYGDDIPTPNDGLLGFIDNLQSVMKVGQDFGIPVRVPLIDWVTRLDKETRELLKEDSRAKLQSMSTKEAENLKVWNDLDVWHGSPHEFEAFSMEKIGTGEGAQAYGHGLYFAERPEVSKSYAEMGEKWTINGQRFNPENPFHRAIGMVDEYGSYGAAIRNARVMIKRDPGDYFEQVLRYLEKGDLPKPVKEKEGQMYRVRLHVNKEDLLDWDKPLSEQGIDFEKVNRQSGYGQPLLEGMTGEEAYRNLSYIMGPKIASKLLAEAGIPGLKYLDQGSRFKNEHLDNLVKEIKEVEKAWAKETDPGLKEEYSKMLDQLHAEADKYEAQHETHNIVMFDDSKIEIIHRNGEAIRSVRQSSGLEPQSEILSGVKEERKYESAKLKLARLSEKDREDLDINMGSKDAFDITDEKGNVVGTLQGQKIGTNFFVDWVSSRAWAQSFGPKQVRALIEELKREYPDLETVSGDRVTGARTGSERQGERVTLKLDAPEIDQVFEEAAKRRPLPKALEQGVEVSYGKDREGLEVKRLLKPKEFWLEHEKRIEEIVDGVIKKIVPEGSVEYGSAHRISYGPERPQGVYLPFKNRLPVIVWSLTSTDRIATGAHEALHHLRETGVISEKEWAILMKAAEDENWIRKHNIEERYADSSLDQKLEEAIADRFGDYVSGKYKPEGAAWEKIAEKIKEILAEIKLKFKEAFGREITADDLFERIRTGGMRKRRPLTERPNYTLDLNDVKQAKREYTPEEKARIEAAKEWDRLEQKVADGIELTPEEAKKLDDLRIGAIQEPTADDLAAQKFYERTKPKLQKEKQLELPGVTRVEDQQVFEKASGMGLTVKQYKQYMQAIERVREADRKYQEEKAEAYERKKQTKEWKKEAAELEPKVEEELQALPEFRANEFFRTGVLDGEKLKTRPKIGAEYIPPWMKEGPPKDYIAKKGMHPDDAAGLLGIDSGQTLMQMLADWEVARKQADATPERFGQELIRSEVERRMSQKYGPLSENIIDEARGHVINNAQLELIHQEVLAAALRAGSDLPISKKEMESFAKEQFRQAPIGNVSLEEVLREMGKAQRAAAMALLDGDPKAAFKFEQQRMMAFYAAREAKKLEAAQRVFDRNVKRFSEREVANFPQEYTNFIHDILMKLGAGRLNFTFPDWQKRIEAESHQSLWDFVSYKMNNDLLEIKFDDRMFDDNLRDQKNRPPLDNLTVQEFMNAHEFIQSLIKNGRDEYKIERAGEIAERDAARQEIIDQLAEFAPLNFDAKGGRWLGPIPPGPASMIRRFGVAHLQWESIANRIDRGDPHGPFSRYVMRPLIEAANGVAPLERKYAAKLKMLDDGVNLKEKIPNNLFIEPTTLELGPGDQRFMPMTRENLRKVLLYWGSESGRKKLSEGYNLEPDRIQAWLDQHATREDYAWADKLGKIWRELKDEIDVMYQNVAGAPPEDIKLAQLVNPWGDRYEGWYHPLVPHPNVEMSKIGGAPTYADGLVQQNFFRATTANGHIMRRTGAVYALDLGLDSTSSVMKRQIYDLSMRPGLIEASKFLRDRQVRTALTRHFGKEYTEAIDPYLSDVANAMNNNDAAANAFMQVWNAFRSNVIGTMIGFNPGTVMKHGPTALVQSITEVGPVNFANAVRGLWQINQKTGERNWTFAMNTSEELQRRHQHYLETLKGQNAQVLGQTTWRERMLSAGAWPVAISDLVSAVPTWIAQYEKSMKDGTTHGDAVYEADRAVRRAHGSTAVTNRPSVMRGGFGMSLLNPVYGFFSHILNRQYEMAWRAKDLVQGTTKGEVTPSQFAKASGALAVMYVSYIIAPAIIEELVSPLPSKPDEEWGSKAAKMMGFSLGSSWIGVRDVAHFWAGGFDPSIGITGPITQATRDLINDITNPSRSISEENRGKTIKHAMTAAGMATGMTPAQLGRWAQLAYDYSIDKDVPQDFWQWLVALRFGQLKGHSRSPEEYAEHLVGAH